jgi:hypothetical protein
VELAASVRLTSGQEPTSPASPSDFNKLRRPKVIDPPSNPFLPHKTERKLLLQDILLSAPLFSKEKLQVSSKKASSETLEV